MDRLTKEQRRRNMQAVRSTGSKAEVLLAKKLYSLGYRYRKNDRTVFGKPDLTLKKYKLAIFVDGEFWHGKNWDVRKNDHKTNREFWFSKIEKNIERDKTVNDKLNEQGWIVLRFWGRDVIKNLDSCIFRIEEVLKGSY